MYKNDEFICTSSKSTTKMFPPGLFYLIFLYLWIEHCEFRKITWQEIRKNYIAYEQIDIKNSLPLFHFDVCNKIRGIFQRLFTRSILCKMMQLCISSVWDSTTVAHGGYYIEIIIYILYGNLMKNRKMHLFMHLIVQTHIDTCPWNHLSCRTSLRNRKCNTK